MQKIGLRRAEEEEEGSLAVFQNALIIVRSTLHLALYAFPNRNSKEKKYLRKRWIHLIHRKNFNSTNGHRVCSEHFKGGRRTYTNNVPTITPKTENIVKPEPRPTVRARNRDVLSETNVNSDTSATSTEIMEVDNEYFPSDDETAREDFVLQSKKSHKTPLQLHLHS